MLRLENKVRSLSESERGYIGGIVDGEGSLLIEKNHSKGHLRLFPYLRIANTSLDLLKHVRGVIGCGTIHNHEWAKRLEKNRRPTWYYSLSAGGLRTLLPQIKDHLVLKKPNCELLIEFLGITRKKWGSRKLRPITDRELQILSEIKKFNRRGN
jgi:hypothetical protein